MDPLKPVAIEQQIRQEEAKPENQQQALFRFDVMLTDILLFGAGSLNPEQQELQKKLKNEYLCNLKPGDDVEISLTGGAYNNQGGKVVSNDGKIVKIESDSFLNKKKKIGIRSFRIEDGFSSGPACFDEYAPKGVMWFFIDIPESHRVKSTAGLPQELREEAEKIYDQLGEPTTYLGLMNNEK